MVTFKGHSGNLRVRQCKPGEHFGTLDAIWGYLEASIGLILVYFLANLGAVLGHLEASFGLFWAILGYPGAVLDHLGARLGLSPPILGCLGAVLGHLEVILYLSLGTSVF